MLFRDKGSEIVAAMSGHVTAVGDVDEPIFAGKVAGDGVAIIPASGEAVAPISGTVSLIGKQKHTYGITGFDGIEVLLHIGIDTVKLNGEGFTPAVKVGDRVQAGDLICTVDLDLLRARHFDTTSPLIITSGSMDRIKRLTLRTGQAAAGQTAVMRYVLNK